jgi:hypothetical protein
MSSPATWLAAITREPIMAASGSLRKPHSVPGDAAVKARLTSPRPAWPGWAESCSPPCGRRIAGASFPNPGFLAFPLLGVVGRRRRPAADPAAERARGPQSMRNHPGMPPRSRGAARERRGSGMRTPGPGPETSGPSVQWALDTHGQPAYPRTTCPRTEPTREFPVENQPARGLQSQEGGHRVA